MSSKKKKDARRRYTADLPKLLQCYDTTGNKAPVCLHSDLQLIMGLIWSKLDVLSFLASPCRIKRDPCWLMTCMQLDHCAMLQRLLLCVTLKFHLCCVSAMARLGMEGHHLLLLKLCYPIGRSTTIKRKGCMMVSWPLGSMGTFQASL